MIQNRPFWATQFYQHRDWYFSGGVDNCVKLWDARAICNPEDDEEEKSNEK